MKENPRAALRGDVQKKLFAITSNLGSAAVPLSEIAREAPLRGIHYARLESAARELARKGYIEFDGVMVEKSLVDRAAGVLGSRLNQFLREGWRVQRWPEGQRVTQSEALGPLPGAKVDQLKERGVDLVRALKSNPMNWTERAVDPGWPRTWVNDDMSFVIEDRGGSFQLWDTNGMGMRHDYWAKKGLYSSLEQAKRASLTVNPYGSFSPSSQPRTGLTKKGERMVADIESSREYGARTPAVAHATVYARAHERPGTGLVTKRWAAEHGYPRPNPGEYPLREWARTMSHGRRSRTSAGALTAFEAIYYADQLGWGIGKYSDPVEGARRGLSVSEAQDIAREDPGLIYFYTPKSNPSAAAEHGYPRQNPVELETTGYMRSEDLEEGDGPWSVSYGRYENRPHPSRGYDTPVHVISEATGSDYEGGLVYRSNYEAIQEMVDEDDELKPFIVYMYGGHGTYGVAIRLDQGEVPNELLEVVGALSSYPILDEDRHSRMEMEAEDEAWQSYGREEWRDALKNEYPDNEDEIDELSDEELDNLWFSQDLSWNAQHEEGGAVVFNFDEAVGNVDFEE